MQKDQMLKIHMSDYEKQTERKSTGFTYKRLSLNSSNVCEILRFIKSRTALKN